MTSLRYGTDEVMVDDDGASIWSSRTMPDWEVRRYRPIQIIIQDRAYTITTKQVTNSSRLIYRLEPWGNRTDIPGRIIRYDEQYVAERDAQDEEERRRRRIGALLPLAYPLIGFSWVSVKTRLQSRYGLCPVRATKWSIAIELPCWILATLAFWFSISVEMLVGASIPMLILGSDLLMRFDDVFHEIPIPRGFLEWIWHGRKLEA